MHDDRDVAARFAAGEWFLRQFAWEQQLALLRERAERDDEAIRIEPMSARFANVESVRGEMRVA